jgi:peptidoglycan/xylan/chitin deacetylase (PgdA/CDA1 family)
LIGRVHNQPIINLTFHGVGPCERSLAPGERDVWVGLTPFLNVLDAAAERGDVTITFDDGNASDVEIALPALRERDLTARFFVVAGRVGIPGFVDDQGIRALADAGMTIGSHGMLHRRWRSLDDRSLREELVDSRRVLEEIVERPVTDAACPFGSYDRRVLRRLRRCGYNHVYTSDRGMARPTAWLQTRNTVRRGDGADLLARISSRPPAHERLARRVRRTAKRWR